MVITSNYGLMLAAVDSPTAAYGVWLHTAESDRTEGKHKQRLETYLLDRGRYGRRRTTHTSDLPHAWEHCNKDNSEREYRVELESALMLPSNARVTHLVYTVKG